MWCLLYYLPLYYEGVKGYSPIVAGVALFPQTFTVAPAAVLVGVIVSITGRYRWAIWLGWVFTCAGLGLIHLLDVDTSTVAWIFLNLVAGLGTGVLFPSLAMAIQASASVEDVAFAVALFSFFRAFGQAIGVAIGGVIFQNSIKKKLLTYPALAGKADEYSQDAASLVQIIKQMSDSLPEKAQLTQSYADSLKVVWAVMAGLAGLALLLSLFTGAYSLDVDLQTEQGFQKDKRVEDVERK